VVEVEVEVDVELEVAVEVEVEVELEVDVGGADSGTCVLGVADPGQAEEPHPVRLIVAKASVMKKNCRNLLTELGE